MWSRHRHRGPHGHDHIDRQRLVSLLMVVGGGARASFWLVLIVLALCGVGFIVNAFHEVFWVAILSLYANFATDLSTVAGSWASLVAGDAHHDAEASRRLIRTGVEEVDADIARLAELQPGPEASELAEQIRRRLSKES